MNGVAGTSLLEAVAAVAAASVLSAGGVLAARDALAVMRAVDRRDDALSAARHLVEVARASPCNPAGARSHCPAHLACTLSRQLLSRRSVEHGRVSAIRVEVRTAAGEDPPLILSTAARSTEPCG